MAKKKTIEPEQDSARTDGESAEPEFKVEDRRHASQLDDAGDDETVEVAPARPSVLDEYRLRAEEAERKLLEYIEAFKRHQAEQDEVRQRLNRGVDQKVELKFAALVGDLLETLDDLDLSLEHVRDVPAAAPLAQGVEMARNRFLSILERHGVVRFSPEGHTFDPNEAEALRVDPVDSADVDQKVTETLKPGYRLGDRVIRAARVAVGRHKATE